jgi:poly(hydroxyalkanoate) granule-associated protein
LLDGRLRARLNLDIRKEAVMNANTIGATGEMGTPTTESHKEATEAASSLRSIWWFGLGAVAFAGAFTAQLVNSLVQRGKEVEPQLGSPLKKAEEGVSEALAGAGTRLKEFGGTLGRGAQKVETALEERIAAAFQSAQAPLRKEVQDLTQKVEELRAKLDQLQPKGQEPPENPGA